VVPLNLRLAELPPTGCKYPYGDAGDFKFCGHPKMEKMPYCLAHCALCYRPDPLR